MGETEVVRVLIVDDHPMMRSGLAKCLDEADDLQVVGEAGDGAEAVAACERLRPDVVLMDLVMPGMGGVEAMTAIRQVSPGVSVLVLTSHIEGALVQRALDAGAVGYLLKDVRPEALVNAVREAAAGRGAVDAAAMRAMMRLSDGLVGHDLTEREVLRLLATGMTNDEIAEKLVVSSGTVRIQVSSILMKLHAPNRTTAALIAIDHGLVERSPV